ncbi:hypothetical protein BH11ACT8_BH11ACT8_10010 [soil metagenome]
MSHSRPARGRARTVALGAVLVAALASAPFVATGSSTAAGPSAAQDEKPLPDVSPADTLGKKLLSVVFDGADTTLVAGKAFSVSGTIAKVTQAQFAQRGGAVAGSFTLAVTDATGRVLGTQQVTSAPDGSFSTTVPGSLTARAVGVEDVSLAVRALDAKADGGYATKDAGAGAVTLRGRANSLELTNSFVSSVGWVKPGDAYPSRIIVTNPTGKTIRGARVVVRAPRGTAFRKASGPGSHRVRATTVTWKLKPVTAKKSATLVLVSKTKTLKQLPTLVWRDLSTKAELKVGRKRSRATSHGPRVIPPSDIYNTARYGDRPFPVVPLQYTDRTYAGNHSGEGLAEVINGKGFKGSTFNLYQEMSLKQLYPNGDVPSAGIATADFDYRPGFPFTGIDPTNVNTCTGVTLADSPIPLEGTPAYPERITDGVYNLPGTTAWYGSDANGSAVVGSLAGVAALQQIDSGCGATGKIVADAVALADPEIDYSDFDTDKDGVVDFFMAVYAGCGGNGASQLGVCSSAPSDALPYDNIWPHSSSLEYSYSDPKTGLPGFVTDDQLKNLEGKPLFYTNKTYQRTTTKKTPYKVFVRVGPYNLNPETALDKASVISHEYGHSLGLPDFYSTGSRETYGDWNLMATDKSQNMDAFSRQELGWVVPEVLGTGKHLIKNWPDSKQNVGVIHWKTAAGKTYTLKNGRDGIVRNSRMYVAKLPGRSLLDPAAFNTGTKASRSHLWFSGAGNDFGCATDGGGHNLDFSVPGLSKLPAGSTVQLDIRSMFNIEWDFDYGFVLTSEDGGDTFTSQPSERSVATTTASTNPNSNACQAAYGNGITGSSSSYTDALTVQLDRTAGNQPKEKFLSDSFDISELAGATTPVLRFSYSTDPGLALPGWFIDDLKVTATTPSGTKVLMRTNFEKSGGIDDPRVFNGGCQDDAPGGSCTKGWQYIKAGAEADFDHAYYLEMRDRSGFDLNGQGQIDRDPIGWTPGLYLGYTDEAHGYGNAGTADPPAQSPLDSKPTPGSATPNLNDAAFTASKGRNVFNDFLSGAASKKKLQGHTDNYEDPSSSSVDPRYSDVSDPWRFTYGCLKFNVLKMVGTDLGPATSNGNLSGTVRIRIGSGCGAFNYGYDTDSRPVKNTAPRARIRVSDTTVTVGTVVRFDATGSTDQQTPKKLDYTWSWDDGGTLKDAGGVKAQHAFTEPGTYRVRLRVGDPQGKASVRSVVITVS